jgi:hypothetical protein
VLQTRGFHDWARGLFARRPEGGPSEARLAEHYHRKLQAPHSSEINISDRRKLADNCVRSQKPQFPLTKRHFIFFA